MTKEPTDQTEEETAAAVASEEMPKHAPLVQITLYQCGNPDCNFATTRLRAFFKGTKTTSDMMGSYQVPNLVCPVCGTHIDDGR